MGLCMVAGGKVYPVDNDIPNGIGMIYRLCDMIYSKEYDIFSRERKY